MFELLTTIIFAWLMIKAVGLIFKLTWSIASVVAGVLMIIALPVLVICLLFVGGIALLVPIVIVAIAWGILEACV